jgi:hypothetical protein
MEPASCLERVPQDAPKPASCPRPYSSASTGAASCLKVWRVRQFEAASCPDRRFHLHFGAASWLSPGHHLLLRQPAGSVHVLPSCWGSQLAQSTSSPLVGAASCPPHLHPGSGSNTRGRTVRGAGRGGLEYLELGEFRCAERHRLDHGRARLARGRRDAQA